MGSRYAAADVDPLRQSAAVWHAYAGNACNRQSCWEKTILPVALRVPVVVTECGHGIQWAQGLFAWIEKQGGSISYLPWTWNTWGNTRNDTAYAAGSGEALVTDYSGAPTQWGSAVKSAFAKATVGVTNVDGLG